jgi:hypothetical protein
VLATFENGEAVFNKGKAARELSHDIVALASCAGSGRGANRRSRPPGLLDLGSVMGPGICRERRADGDPALRQLGLAEIAQESGEVILPQVQVAAGEILSVGHCKQYTPGRHPRKRPVCRRRFFDEVISPNQCIVR